MNRKADKERTLPDGWQEVRLGDVGTFSKGTGITKGELVTDGVPCVRYGEIYTKHNYKIKNFHSFISNERDFKKLKIIKDNDLLFAGSGETREEIGKCVSFNHNVEVYAGGDVIICSIKPEKLRADFASYYLNTLGRNQMGMLGQGDSIVHIYGRFLKNVTIPVPSLPEQKAIASLLETWDTAIEKTEALIAAKEKQFKWLIKTLISDQQDNPEWRKVRLGEVCSINEEVLSSKTSGNYCFEYISLSDVERGKLTQTHKYKFSEAPSRARMVVRQGDVLLATVRPNLQGFFVFKDQVENCIASTGFAVLRANPKLLYSLFLFQFLFSNKMLATYYAINVGSNYPAINSSDIPKFRISLPPLPEQKRIAKVLDTVNKEIDLLKQLSEQHRTQKRGLMQKLLMGKWKTK